MQYRAALRGFDLEKIEAIVRYSPERYLDKSTGRQIAVGQHGKTLVVVPYEADDETITPITVHATTRQQINFRLVSGRYSYD